MRVCSLFFEDLPADLGRPPYQTGEVHGRLLMTLRIAWGVASHPDVAEFAICDRDARVVPGATTVPAAELGAWLASDGDGDGGAVWFEPARHYWWKAALARQHTGVRVPIVTMLHGLGYSRQIAPLLSSLATPAGPGDTIIAPSKASAGALRTQCANLIEVLGLNRDVPRIVVVPYGVPPVVSTPREAARAAFGWGDEPVVLFVGRLSTGDKADFDALFEAASRLRTEGIEFHLVMAGTVADDWLDVLRQLAQAHGMGDVEVRVNVSDVEKHLLLSGCDVFVSPSNTVSESFGLTLVEAMLHGLPVVATDWSGYREIVRDGVDGFLVPTAWGVDEADGAPDLAFVFGTNEELSEHVAVDVDSLTESLSRLLEDKALRDRFGASGHQRASSHFLLERTVDDVVRVLQEARAECGPFSTPLTLPRPLRIARAFAGYASLPGAGCTCEGPPTLIGGGPSCVRRLAYGRRIAWVFVPALKIWPPDAL